MPRIRDASPRIRVYLYKTISRTSVDGTSVVSQRYKGKDQFIDLTPFLDDRSSVRTMKSVKEPAGAFAITIADAPQTSYSTPGAMESIYGLVEPMDLIEIRMWSGLGPTPAQYPIVMRGFVTEISRAQSSGENGAPQKQVTISGQDFGKIWQMYQILYLSAYAEGAALLTTFGLFELFGITAQNAMPAAEFIKQIVEKVINPYLDKMLPDTWDGVPRMIQTGKSISVKHGVIGAGAQQQQGTLYDIMKRYGDVGIWNELYTEDREDGVHCVYRSVPSIHLTHPKGATSDLIMEDALEPIFVNVPDELVESISQARTDANVANFFWVESTIAELQTDIQRKLAAIPQNDSRVVIKDYANNDAKYYGLRPMYGNTMQYGDKTTYTLTGLDKDGQEKRETILESWVDKRRRQMMELNKDNVVFERGTARVKGGIMRPDGKEMLKAGDYVVFHMGVLTFMAYVVGVDHDFQNFNSYTTTITFDRATGFVERIQAGFGKASPWLGERATRIGSVLPGPDFIDDGVVT